MRLTLTKFAPVIISLIVLAAGPGRADVHAGVEAYKQGDYETALREFADLAKNGDPRAQYNLAVMYLKGRGVEKNLERAFDIQRRAAERGFPTSQLNLGVMYISGQGVERDDAEVVKWITLAAAKGVPEALFRLGRMYEQGTIFAQSDRDAMYWYGKSGERGFTEGEKHFRRLTALNAARQPDAPTGADAAARNIPSVKNVEIRPEDAKSPDPAPAPISSPALQSPPPRAPATPAPEPQRAKSALETVAKTNSAPTPDYWRVQLASFRTLREAERAWKNLKRKFAFEFEGLRPDVVLVDLGEERGVYHRLRASPLGSRDAAFAFCNKLKLKSSKQGCIPLSPRRSGMN